MHELPTGTAVQEAAGCTVGTSQLSAPRELVSVHSERLMSIADRTHVCEHGGTEGAVHENELPTGGRGPQLEHESAPRRLKSASRAPGDCRLHVWSSAWRHRGCRA